VGGVSPHDISKHAVHSIFRSFGIQSSDLIILEEQGGCFTFVNELSGVLLLVLDCVFGLASVGAAHGIHFVLQQ
jgi:hypothetical protein